MHEPWHLAQALLSCEDLICWWLNKGNTYLSLQQCRPPAVPYFLMRNLFNLTFWKLASFVFLLEVYSLKNSSEKFSLIIFKKLKELKQFRILNYLLRGGGDSKNSLRSENNSMRRKYVILCTPGLVSSKNEWKSSASFEQTWICIIYSFLT